MNPHLNQKSDDIHQDDPLSRAQYPWIREISEMQVNHVLISIPEDQLLVEYLETCAGWNAEFIDADTVLYFRVPACG